MLQETNYPIYSRRVVSVEPVVDLQVRSTTLLVPMKRAAVTLVAVAFKEEKADIIFVKTAEDAKKVNVIY